MVHLGYDQFSFKTKLWVLASCQRQSVSILRFLITLHSYTLGMRVPGINRKGIVYSAVGYLVADCINISLPPAHAARYALYDLEFCSTTGASKDKELINVHQFIIHAGSAIGSLG